MTRKPIQLHNHDGDLYALCDDGTIWQCTGDGWRQLEPIPQDEELPLDDSLIVQVDMEQMEIGHSKSRKRNRKRQ